MATPRNHQNKLYQVWCQIKGRCLNPSNQAYKNYGGRGVTLCERWLEFDNFLADMGERPTGMTLERVDNNKGYSPDNCRWASRAEQNRNTRKNRLFTIDGQTKIFAEWIRESGLKPSTVSQRFYVYKWPLERALGRI